MTRGQAEALKLGDKLKPKALWNRTSPANKRLPDVVTVSGVYRAQCELGIMVVVHDEHGRRHELSAGWFEVAE